MLTINCRNPLYIKKAEIVVPCGKCFFCRKKYRLQWQLRLQHEFVSYEGVAMFLTLTYNEENLPNDNLLIKRDVQLFIKRLRKFYKDVKIKYFAVGEYGTKKNRPHYHLIIYGLRAPENRNNSKLNFKYGLFLAERIWKKGFCHVGFVNSKCISYVSKYVMKSFISTDGKELELFTLKSTGLGLSYLLKNFKYIKEQILSGNSEDDFF